MNEDSQIQRGWHRWHVLLPTFLIRGRRRQSLATARLIVSHCRLRQAPSCMPAATPPCAAPSWPAPSRPPHPRTCWSPRRTAPSSCTRPMPPSIPASASALTERAAPQPSACSTQPLTALPPAPPAPSAQGRSAIALD